MKTAGEEDPNSHVRLHTEPSPWEGKSEPSSLIHTGWKVRKYPAAGEVFFLTFPFIELIGTWHGNYRMIMLQVYTSEELCVLAGQIEYKAGKRLSRRADRRTSGTGGCADC